VRHVSGSHAAAVENIEGTAAMNHKTLGGDHRPWGFYVILADEPDHKVKRITVYPGNRLSLQCHRRRSEHWHVISGSCVVTLDSETIPLSGGQSVDIPLGAVHRIENTGDVNLAFIEVQRGDYFGEDDIERIEDDFGRVQDQDYQD